MYIFMIWIAEPPTPIWGVTPTYMILFSNDMFPPPNHFLV